MSTNETGQNEAPQTEAQRIALRDDSGGDWQKANDRYFNAVKQNRDLQTNIDALNERLGGLENLLGSRVNPNERRSGSAVDRIANEWAIPADDLRDAISEIAREEVRGSLQPLAEGMAARNKAVQRFGKEFVENESEMLNWVANDAEASETYNALMAVNKHEQAYNYGWNMFRAARSEQTPPTPSAEDASRRNAARVPSNSAPASRNPAGQHDEREEFTSAVDNYRFDRDLRPVAKALWRGKPLTWDEHLRAMMQEGRD